MERYIFRRISNWPRENIFKCKNHVESKLQYCPIDCWWYIFCMSEMFELQFNVFNRNLFYLGWDRSCSWQVVPIDSTSQHLVLSNCHTVRIVIISRNHHSTNQGNNTFANTFDYNNFFHYRWASLSEAVLPALVTKVSIQTIFPTKPPKPKSSFH